MNIYYRPKEMKVETINNGEIRRESRIVILQYMGDNVWIPSKLTDYIETELNRQALNTRLKHAKSICKFMNFLIENVEKGEDELYTPLREKGLYGLNLHHLAKYITYVTESTDNLYKTVKDTEKELLKFMWFLNRRGITGKDAKIESYIIAKSGKKTYGSTKGQRVWINPFDDRSKYSISYPPKDKPCVNPKEILKDLEIDVWEQLLEFAEKYYPRIAFGVAIQIMAGLRQGEVVNLRIKDVSVNREKNCIIFEIRDNTQELFIDRNIKINKSQIKPNRVTIAIAENFNGRLLEMYEEHLGRIMLVLKNKGKTSKGALFINSNGEPMTGNSYQNDFRELKKAFLELVGESSMSLFEKLESKRWGSHIGRHIFTNHLVKTGAVDDISGTPNPVLLQQRRRDKHPQSSSDYLDEMAVFDAGQRNINRLSNCLVEKDKNNK